MIRTWSSACALARVSVLAALLFVSACSRSGPPPPVLDKLDEFSLLNQANKPFGTKELRGKIWVASFMFTRCPTVCPRMMQFQKKVQHQAKEREVPLHLVTFSVDPDNDTPAVLQEFAGKYSVDLETWTFLTGDDEAIKRASVQGFKLALEGTADPSKPDLGILHGSTLVLVDGRMQLRGYYPTNDELSIDRLLSDARTLARSGG